MLNLIIKDILIQKKIFLYVLLCSILLPICFYSFNLVGLVLYVLVPISTTYSFINYGITYDDKNKSEIILNSLPLNRADIVISKYLSIFGFAVIGIIYSIVIGFIGKSAGLSMFTSSISLVNIISVLTSVCIFGAIFFLTYFKFGYMKSRIFNTVIFVAMLFFPMEAIPFATRNPNNILVQKFNYFIVNTSGFMLNSLALIVGLIIFLVSLLISIRIYNNKEY